jgi:hypothetical protein
MALIYAGGKWRDVPDGQTATSGDVRGQTFAPLPSMAQVAAAQSGGDTIQPLDKEIDTGGGSGMSDADRARLAGIESQLAALKSANEARARQEREDAEVFLSSILRQYNLDSLVPQVSKLIADFGSTNETVIAEKLRQTDPYKKRFKGLIALQERGITDVSNEAQYLDLESDYRQVFRDNDMQAYLGEAGSEAERDKIADIVGNFSLSVNEVRDRVIDARRVVADTPQEVRESLQRYYNIDPALLTEFVLDPINSSEVVNRRANAAIVGGYGIRTGLEFGAPVAERIGEFLGRGDNLSTSVLEPQLTRISEVQRATGRLAEIEGGTLTAEETALGELELEASARERVRGLQSRERARFGGTSGVTSGSLARTPSL